LAASRFAAMRSASVWFIAFPPVIPASAGGLFKCE
jgi:hypothetical protein